MALYRRSLGRGAVVDLIARLSPDPSPDGYDDQPAVKRPPKAKRSPKRSPAAVPTEHEEQVALLRWAFMSACRYPEMDDLYSIPNFSGRLGKVPPVAAMRQAQKLNAEGRRKGVPDLHLPHARGMWHSLYVELKRVKGGTVSAEQRDWHERLTRAGHRVVVCRGWESARDAILEYLNLSPISEAHRS
ncbi:MAG: VRR-NUC domain-containing protein [Gemmatimonadaceae bacterium]